MTVAVHNFSNGLVNPVLGYAMSCLGAFLGLRCVTRARAYSGAARARWLILAAVAIGAGSVWAMHFIAMLGFTIPGQTILYNVPVTIVSMLIAIVVVGIGLFIVSYGNGGWRPLIIGGVIVGIGVASMHYLGMEAMSMPDTMRYNAPLFAASVVIAIVAGTAALWAGTRVRSVRATVVASLIFGVAVSGMHYTGMAAMEVYPASSGSGGSMAAMGGASAISFIVPLLAGISLLMFGLTLAITLSPNEAEIHEDAVLRQRMETEFSDSLRAQSGGAAVPAAPAQGPGRVTPRAGASSAFTPGGYVNGNGYANGSGYANGNGNGYANGNGQGQDRANGYNGGSQHGNDQPGPSPRPLPTRRPPRDGGGPGSL
jgi:NO-binding membrane sensor protein with MHYT domain